MKRTFSFYLDISNILLIPNRYLPKLMRSITYQLPILFILILTSASVFSSCRHHGNEGRWAMPEKELKSLESAIKNAEKYRKLSEAKADSLKQLLKKPNISNSEKLQILQEIVAYYRPRMADSSLNYAYMTYNLAKETGNRNEINLGLLAIADAQSASGYFSAAIMTYDSISMSDAPKDDMLTYWYTGRQLYSNLCNYIGERKGLYEIYQSKEDECRDSLIANLPANNDFRSFLISGVQINNGKDKLAIEELEPLLPTLIKGSQIYGMTTFQLSQAYRRIDQTKYAAYLALAAESDVIGGINDGFALPSLSELLYKEKHYQEAFQYINFAMNDAYRGSARMRLVNISSLVPSIDEAYRNEINDSLSDFTLYALMVSVILIILIVILALLLREMRKRRQAHTQLASLSKMKDSYIRDFIGLCSAYSEKYDILAKTVTRKITAGQSQDLLKLLKNGKASESENEEFYQTIDRVFMSLYPDFIEQINNLLLPDQRYDIDKNSESLNPELRIYGFVRLGLAESAKIAKILNYSANTVYSYRNRMRNKAINRDTFDEDVMKIDSDETEDQWGI
ncbi:MAG: hypothetical protein K2M39_08235 [Muribaculaceae bacterium]|nr:hypothetical protein [Muribaculaceae bacterium]